MGIVVLALVIVSSIGMFTWMIYLFGGSHDEAFLSEGILSELSSLALLREKLLAACLILFVMFMITVCIFSGVMGVYSVMHDSGLPRWKSAANKLIGEKPVWDYDKKSELSGEP